MQGTLPIFGKLAHLQTNIIQSSFESWPPILKGSRRTLQSFNTSILRHDQISELALPLVVRLVEADLPLIFCLSEALLPFRARFSEPTSRLTP
jgi:hypothetical protein